MPTRKVLEAHELLEEGQGDFAGGAVALLGDDDLDGAFVLAGFVHFRAVQEHDGVGVLLEAVVYDEFVGHKIRRAGDSQIVDLFFAVWPDRGNLVPVNITGCQSGDKIITPNGAG
jgi:hypothetical protein